MALLRRQPWSLVVLHDLPTGAMAALPRFIAMVRDAGGRFRQDFPPDCVPLRRGRIAAPMAPFVADPVGLGGRLPSPGGSGTPGP